MLNNCALGFLGALVWCIYLFLIPAEINNYLINKDNFFWYVSCLTRLERYFAVFIALFWVSIASKPSIFHFN